MKNLFDNSLILALAVAMLVFAQASSAQTSPAFVLAWGEYGSGPGQFGNDPLGIAVDTADNVYVGDSGNHRVQKFTSTGVYLTEWGSHGTGDGQFMGYLAVAVDDSFNVYVIDFISEYVQKFTSTGVFLLRWGGPSSGFPGEPGKFDTPTGIAVDDSFNVYTAENIPDRVQKFTSMGEFITLWGQTGSGEGSLNFPYGVAAGPDGKVIVGDSGNHRIQTFTTVGDFVQTWGWGVSTGTPTFERCTSGCRSGIPGNGNGQFNIRTTVAVDSSTVYVADWDNHRVQYFSGDNASYLGQWGRNGSGNEEFNAPSGIALDTLGYIYVADRWNHRIQKFEPLPPVSVEPSGVGHQPVPLPPFPNPSSGSFTFTVMMPQMGVPSVAVVDVRGRVVRRIPSGMLAAGQHLFHWDGRDGHGQPAATGFYLILIKTHDSTWSQKILVRR